jgi:methionine synthase I (cobalamin-dependent)
MRFLEEVEQGIRAANREVIHGQIPALNRESFLNFAIVVARLRADYLAAALKASHTGRVDAALIEALKALRQQREAFEEARAAFDALQRAIERGYVEISIERTAAAPDAAPPAAAADKGKPSGGS